MRAAQSLVSLVTPCRIYTMTVPLREGPPSNSCRLRSVPRYRGSSASLYALVSTAVEQHASMRLRRRARREVCTAAVLPTYTEHIGE